MTRLIRTEVLFADAALGVAAEAADRTEGLYFQHLVLPNAVAHPTLLDPPTRKSNAPPVTEIRFARFKVISLKRQRTLATSRWSLLRSASFAWPLTSAPMKPSRNWRILRTALAILNIMRGRMRKSLEIETYIPPRTFRILPIVAITTYIRNIYRILNTG